MNEFTRVDADGERGPATPMDYAGRADAELDDKVVLAIISAGTFGVPCPSLEELGAVIERGERGTRRRLRRLVGEGRVEFSTTDRGRRRRARAKLTDGSWSKWTELNDVGPGGPGERADRASLDDRLFAMISEAARKGDPIPTRSAMSDALKSCDSSLRIAEHRLSEAGRVRFEYDGTVRRRAFVGPLATDWNRSPAPIPTVARAEKPIIPAAPKPAPKPAVAAPEMKAHPPAPAPVPRPPLDLSPARTCQFIAKNDPPFAESDKCGRPSKPGYSYCAEHQAITYRRVRAGEWETGE